MAQKTLNFQAEVNQLLDLVAHSLYSDDSIFIRELISNACDAIEKARYALKAGKVADGTGPDSFQVKVIVDPDNKTISVVDNGIGMNQDEVVEHLGTIAKSGTKAFLEQLNQAKDQTQKSNLIGKFGVGFYSSFVVADQVTVHTRQLGGSEKEGVIWASDGKGSYTLDSCVQKDIGTRVTVTLKEDKSKYLESWQVEKIIRDYSDYLPHDILLTVLPTKAELAAAEDKKNKKDDQKDDANSPAQPEPITDKLINKGTALWLQPRNKITEEQYKTFYEHNVGYGKPMAWIDYRAEGRLNYNVILFVPEKAPFDLYQRENKGGIKLYVQRVFIMDDARQFLPAYLRFMRGIIDCADLPLNVSRELLQSNKDVDSIRSVCTKKALGLLENMSTKEADKYALFWQEYGQALKEGVGEDFSNREQLAGLYRFSSTHVTEEAQTVSLADYISRMQKDQKFIYYVTADSLSAAQTSPHLELFSKKNIEVILLHDRVDEWLVSHLTEYKGHQLKSVARADLEESTLTEEEKNTQKKAESDFSDVLKRVKACLGDQVQEVRLSGRLTESPACLVAGANDLSGNLKRMLKEAGQQFPDSKPILEMNAEHAMVKHLLNEQSEARFSDWCTVLLSQAMLAEGGQLENPASYVKCVNKLMEELV
jgi:molecular chaperone HtpG